MLCSEVMHKGVVDSKGDEEERMVDVLGRDECFRRHGQVQVPLTAISGRTASPCLPLSLLDDHLSNNSSSFLFLIVH